VTAQPLPGRRILFVHIGHGVLFWLVLVILALELPWWASLLLLPLAAFSVAGWAYEARFVLPVATRLWRGEQIAPRTDTNITSSY